jgi:hypothetical protein
VRERPSFEDITLYQLCYWKVTRIYGLTPEEIEDLLTNPDPRTLTYLPREVPSHYNTGFLPAYLPRDRFEPSERVVPLVDHQYRRDYRTWKNYLDANTRATKSLVDHVTDPLYQVIEAPLSIPEPIFFHTVRAAELRWWNGYLNTYHSFNDLILLRDHYEDSFNYRIKTVSWHAGKSARDIYATALTIFQVGQPTIRPTSYSTPIWPEWRTGKALRFLSFSITKSRFGYMINYNLLTNRPPITRR